MAHDDSAGCVWPLNVPAANRWLHAETGCVIIEAMQRNSDAEGRDMGIDA